MKIKALSIRQPWAWLLVNGWRNIEYRTWQTKHRGQIAIHASKRIDAEGMAEIEHHFKAVEKCKPPASLYWTGGIVGLVDLVDCVYSPDNKDYDWIIANAQPCELIPMAGRLHLFDVEID